MKLTLIWDISALVGLICLIVGAALVWVPLGWLTAGIGLIGLGLLGVRSHVFDKPTAE
jgi:hypothetical protein